MSCGFPAGFPAGSRGFPEGFRGQKDRFMTGGSIHFLFDMYLQVFIYQINITYTINNIS